MIDVPDLTAFVRLCDTGNLTRAAARCGVSASTLSRSLTRTERELGVRLCRRDRHGLTVTPAGRQFERFARRTLADLAALRSAWDSPGRALRGTVRLFCSVTASYLFIPAILNELHVVHPLLEPHVITGDPADALERLDRGTADAVISALPATLPPTIAHVDLATFPLILVAPRKPRFPTGTGAFLGAYDPGRLPFIMPDKGELRREAARWLQAHGLVPQVYSDIAGHEAIVSLVALGFGLAIVPRPVLEISPFKNDVTALLALQDSRFRVALCVRRARDAEPPLRALLALTARLAPGFAAARPGRTPN